MPARDRRLPLLAALALASAATAAEVHWLETPTARMKVKVETVPGVGLRVLGRWSYPRGPAGKEAMGTKEAVTTFNLGVDALERNDHATAASLWRKAAEAGSARAAFNLGMLYKKGQGIPSNKAAAKQWIEKAAEGNFVQAQVQMGSVAGVSPAERAEVHRWYAKAALAGNARAAYLLGYAYYSPTTGPRCWALAKVWLEKAKALGRNAAEVDLILKTMATISEDKFREMNDVPDIPLEGTTSTRRLTSAKGAAAALSGTSRSKEGFEAALKAANKAVSANAGNLDMKTFGPRVAAVMAAATAMPSTGLTVPQQVQGHMLIGNFYGRLAWERLYGCMYARPATGTPGWMDWKAPAACAEPKKGWGATGGGMVDRGLGDLQEQHLAKAYALAKAEPSMSCEQRMQVAQALVRVRFPEDDEGIRSAWKDMMDCIESTGGFKDRARIGALREYLEWQGGGRVHEIVVLKDSPELPISRMESLANAYVQAQTAAAPAGHPMVLDALATRGRLASAIARKDGKKNRIGCLNANHDLGNAVKGLLKLPPQARRKQVLPNGVVIRGLDELSALMNRCND